MIYIKNNSNYFPSHFSSRLVTCTNTNQIGRKAVVGVRERILTQSILEFAFFCLVFF